MLLMVSTVTVHCDELSSADKPLCVSNACAGHPRQLVGVTCCNAEQKLWFLAFMYL